MEAFRQVSGVSAMRARWRNYVLSEGKWQNHEYERVSTSRRRLDSIWRFKQKDGRARCFTAWAGRALCGVGFGVICQVGQVDGQRFPLLRQIIRHQQEKTKAGHLQS